ncbi:hypothetical protein BDW02DRAFT_177731 [Decorospora gaudefroyi]|uniref:Rhodopsin domain-containing protein n=1 Tax=Decorospora gaudefroyi TaxID=184978 RepID=A0A6A5JWZ4_9PLEO|nr:hypothetical protein BDW02DRAFT_177731 [Decorospora gaudefroyi]
MHGNSPSWFILRSKATANIRYEALVPAVIFTALAFLMVGLRWCSRICSRSASVGLEDYLITVALVFSIGITAVVGGEFGIHAQNLKNDEAHQSSLSTMLRLVLAHAILYHLASNLIKISFTLQYLRLFSLQPLIVWACYTLFVCIIGATAWGIFGNVFLCDPVQSYWDIALSGTCMDKETHWRSTSIIGFLLDIAIWVLPIPLVGKLQLPRRQKMGLLIVFGMGGFVCITTVLRFILVNHAAHHGKVTKSGTYAILFSSIEVNVAIICACLLVMKPLFARFLPAIVSEQPVSAAEDRRNCRALTGGYLLGGMAVDGGGKKRDGRRRDTLIEMNDFARRVGPTLRLKRGKRGLGNGGRHSI